MTKRILIVLITLLSVVLMLLTSGVFATWTYYLNPTSPWSDQFGIDMDAFEYAPEQILPGGSEIQAQLGENHVKLITIILDDAKYGLNSNNKTVVHDTLTSTGSVVYCDQKVTGGNLKHMMLDGVAATERLYFVIEKISDTVYNTYTMSHNDLYTNSYDKYITVYKTVMKVNDKNKWVATVSYEGTAKIFSPSNSSVSRAIDVTTWSDVYF